MSRSQQRTFYYYFRPVEIETPRDRNGSFDPKAVVKRQTSVGNFSEAIVPYTRAA